LAPIPKAGHAGWLDDEEPEPVGTLLMHDEPEIVEGYQRMEFVGQHLDQLSDCLMARERLRDTQQRVVAREV